MRLKKILAILLTAVLLVSSTVIALPVSAEGNATLGGNGELETPYLINSKEDLLTLAASVNDGTLATSGKYFKQTADIDLTDVAWTGIGNSTNQFKGTYDGDGHVITNLTLKDDQNVNGLFGVVDGATIQNVGIASGASTITTSDTADIGNLVGQSPANTNLVTISNCFNAASLTVTVGVAKTCNFGGLLGNMQGNVDITDCWNTGNITVETGDSAKNVGVGGLGGGLASKARLVVEAYIENCHSDCDITVNGTVNTWGGVGSLIGKAGNTNNYFDIINCSAGGKLTVEAMGAYNGSTFTGLFIGWGFGTATYENCTYDVDGNLNGAELTAVTSIGNASKYAGETAGLSEGAVQFLVGNYAQNGTVGETVANSVRFVSELTLGTAGFAKTGFEVTVTYNGNTTEPFPLEGVVVYEQLSAGDGTVTPDNGNYFIAYGISDIPADATATFTVTPYVVTCNDVTIYGEIATFEMVDGDIVDSVAPVDPVA